MNDDFDYDEWMNTPLGKQKNSDWISVNERLPELNEDVIACTSKYSLYFCRYESYGYYQSEQSDLIPRYRWFVLPTGCGCCDPVNIHITHWMPLLKPPKD